MAVEFDMLSRQKSRAFAEKIAHERRLAARSVEPQVDQSLDRLVDRLADDVAPWVMLGIFVPMGTVTGVMTLVMHLWYVSALGLDRSFILGVLTSVTLIAHPWLVYWWMCRKRARRH